MQNLNNILKYLKIIFYFLSPIIIFVIFLLRPLIKVRFSYQSSERLGDISTHMEVYLSEKKILRENRFLDIFILTNIISNETYIELLKKKVIIIPNFITYPIYHTILILRKKINFLNDLILSTKWEDNNFAIMRTNCNLVPDQKFLDKGNTFLKALNIPENAKIICLIVRDNNYLKSKFPKQNWDYQNHRNCNIENYKLAINTATSKGYYVFRMGQNSEKELIIEKNDKFIDYSNKYRTDFLDVFLAYRCNFCITSGTGWDSLPSFVFRKPTVFTNYTPVGNMTTYSKNFLFSIKIHYDLIKKKKMTLREISQSHVAYSFNSKIFDKSKVQLLENTPEDIKDLTLEMIDKLENNFDTPDEDLALQNIFWMKYIDYFNLKNIKPEISKTINPMLCTSKRLYNNKVISKMGSNFLKKYQFLLNDKN